MRITVVAGILAVALCNLQYQDMDEEEQSSSHGTNSENNEIPWTNLEKRDELGYAECPDLIKTENSLPSKKRKVRGYKKQNFKSDSKVREEMPKPLDEICSKYDCPKYEVLPSKGCGYQARRLLSAHWLTTRYTVTKADSRTEYMKAFWRLFKYINGTNADQLKIDMTVPVINIYYMDQSYNITSAEMCFYLGDAYIDTASPAPTDPLVRVVKWEDMVVYDRAFGGHWADKNRWEREFRVLENVMKKADVMPNTHTAITAGYTRPGFGRQRNEAMYMEQ